MSLRLAALFILLAAACGSVRADELSHAVSGGADERVKELLDAGADVNKPYENGCTPIFFADRPEVVDLLLAHGARLDIRDSASMRSPIERAAERHFYDKDRRATWKVIVENLRKAGAEYTVDTATYMNDAEFIEKQLAIDDSWVNKRRGAQSVPLRLAARLGRVEIAKLLLEHKADPDSFEEGHGYPIMRDAVENADVVKLLIKHRANLKRRITWHGGRSGIWVVGDEATALHYAVDAGSLDSVKALLAAGLDPSAANDEGQTALHVAIESERFQTALGKDSAPFEAIVKVLLGNDASLRLMNKSGQTPLEFAQSIESPNNAIVQLLEQAEEQQNARYLRVMFGDR